MSADLRRARLRPLDVPRIALVGPLTNPFRSGLTALGIAIGIAALVAVLGISESSRADLLAQLDALGTNRLQVAPGQSVLGDDVALPESAAERIARLDAVEAVAAVSGVGETVRRSDTIPTTNTGGMSSVAADLSLPDTVGATVAVGRWLDEASEQLPTVVLGSGAAERLGIETIDGRAVLVGDQLLTVIGILDPVPLYGDLDNSVFVGYPLAEEVYGIDPAPTTIYVATTPELVEPVRELLPATVDPESPNEVDVTNPSDALAARDAVDATLTALLLGLGGVSLLVGAIGIANVMVIGVLERRTEIGVRRALGATRGQIRLQFVLEAAALGALGGVLGVALGAAVTAGYATFGDLPVTIPPESAGLGLGAALSIGVLAGLSPAARAARLAPSDAIRPA